jgi:hypothetical protein
MSNDRALHARRQLLGRRVGPESSTAAHSPVGPEEWPRWATRTQPVRGHLSGLTRLWYLARAPGRRERNNGRMSAGVPARCGDFRMRRAG